VRNAPCVATRNCWRRLSRIGEGHRAPSAESTPAGCAHGVSKEPRLPRRFAGIAFGPGFGIERALDLPWPAAASPSDNLSRLQAAMRITELYGGQASAPSNGERGDVHHHAAAVAREM
jgi:hypothetical protein